MADPLHTKRFDRALESLRGIPDPLLRLDAIRRTRKALDDLEAATVVAARAEGVSWRDIGAVYGLSKQGAQQRFRAAPHIADPPVTHLGSHRSGSKPPA